MNQTDFEALLSDTTKCIVNDITWMDDEDHSPTLEFRVEVKSDAGYPIFIKGSYNTLASTLSYTLIHRGSGRIYALDLGKDHHNPSCTNTGEKHKHRWNEPVRDKEAYVPDDITAPLNDPVAVWKQFCVEASIQHNGVLYPPQPYQMIIL
ncbi:conserved hypothetical protein [Gammaproteobacteria bacterium]